MGRNAVLTDEMKHVIAYIKDRHPKWSYRDIEKKIPSFWKILFSKLPITTVPGKSKIGEYITGEYALNKKEVDASGIDKPWSIGSCEKYGIPDDIIPTLFELGQARERKFTIRQARWFARLKPIVFALSAPGRPLEHLLAGMSTTLGETTYQVIHSDPRLALLTIITYMYAGSEQLSELTKQQNPDTSDLDFTVFTEGRIGNDELGEPIVVDEEDWDPMLAFNSRFQTNTIIIRRKEAQK